MLLQYSRQIFNSDAMNPIREIFPLLVASGERLDPDVALYGVVDTSESTADSRRMGRERPVVLQEALRTTLETILADQSTENWWHALRKENVMRHPDLEDWSDGDAFEKTVVSALQQVANGAAHQVYELSTRSNPDDDLAAVTSLTENETINLQLLKLEFMAQKEINIYEENED